MKRSISFLLAVIMAFGTFSVSAFGAEEQSLEHIIRPQIEAFAKSIDQPDADGKAADLSIYLLEKPKINIIQTYFR